MTASLLRWRSLGLAAAVLAVACGRPPSPAGRFLLVADGESQAVSSYAIDSADGSLRHVPGSPFPVGAAGATSVRLHPSGRWGVVVGLGQVSAFSIGPDGRLEPTGAGVPWPGLPKAAALDPAGDVIAIASSWSPVGGGTILTFRAGPDGPRGPRAVICTTSGAADVAMHPSGRWVYYASGEEVHACEVQSAAATVNPAKDVLARVPRAARRMAMHPGGHLLFVLSKGDDVSAALSVFKVDAETPRLAPLSSDPMPVGAGDGLAIDPTGAFLYVTAADDGYVWGYAVHAEGGLRPVPGSPLVTGRGARALGVDADGARVFVGGRYEGEGRDGLVAVAVAAPTGGLAEERDVDVEVRRPGALVVTPGPDEPVRLAALPPGAGLMAPDTVRASARVDPPRSLDEALARLNDPRWRVRWSAVQALTRRADAEQDAANVGLAKAVGDDNITIAEWAMEALALQGTRASAATPALLAQLGHSDAARRRNAAKALAAIGTPEGVAAEARRLDADDQRLLARRLFRPLEQDDRAAAALAARAIGAMPEAADVSVPRLIRLLATGDPTRRRLAADAIGALGPRAAAALPELAGALYDDSFEVRVGASLAVVSVRR